jgi:hypothetical protein
VVTNSDNQTQCLISIIQNQRRKACEAAALCGYTGLRLFLPVISATEDHNGVLAASCPSSQPYRVAPSPEARSKDPISLARGTLYELLDLDQDSMVVDNSILRTRKVEC